MFGYTYKLENIRFADFDAWGIQNMVGILGSQAQFIPVERWNDMTAMTPPLKRYDGIGGRKYAIMRGQAHGYPTEIYVGEQYDVTTTKDREGRETVVEIPEYYLMVSFLLPFWVKNVQVFPHKSLFKRGVKLEGDFSNFFTVYTVKGHEVSAFELLPPDTMMQLLDKTPEVHIEYVQNRIILKVPLENFDRMYGGPDGSVAIRQDAASFFKLVSDLVAAIEELGASAKTGRTNPENYAFIKGHVPWAMLIAFVTFILLFFIFGDEYEKNGSPIGLVLAGIFAGAVGLGFAWDPVKTWFRKKALQKRRDKTNSSGAAL
jgi:hypothetical protein